MSFWSITSARDVKFYFINTEKNHIPDARCIAKNNVTKIMKYNIFTMIRVLCIMYLVFLFLSKIRKHILLSNNLLHYKRFNHSTNFPLLCQAHPVQIIIKAQYIVHAKNIRCTTWHTYKTCTG